MPKGAEHSFPDRHLKPQGSLQNFVFFSIYISFVCYLLCQLLIASLCPVVLLTHPHPPHPPPQFGLLDFLELKHCGICWVLVQRDREQWTLSQGGHASRVLGTCMWGQGWPSVKVCVPGDRE